MQMMKMDVEGLFQNIPKNYHINVLILTNANKGARKFFLIKNKKIRKEAIVVNNFIGTKKLF